MIKYTTHIGEIPINYSEQLNSLRGIIFNRTFDKNFLDIVNVHSNNGLISIFACDGKHIIGYKIGYAKSENTFHSWIGGVHPLFRKNGIASKMLKRQHNVCKEKGYKQITTYSNNKYKDMMRLNLKFDFNIVGVKTNGHHIQVIFEKKIN